MNLSGNISNLLPSKPVPLKSFIKHFPHVFCAFLASALVIHAQESQREEEITTDFGTDEYVYVPKLTLNMGVRTLSGPKASFAGQGVVMSTQDYGPSTGSNLNRNYHDGFVRADARSILDANGNNSPISPDGKTNNWSYLDNNQLTSDGLIAMHSYAAAITDTTRRTRDPDNSYGLDITLSRDMGKLFNTRASWGIVGGMSVNDIRATLNSSVAANITAITDYFSLDGQTPPVAPYYAPTVNSQQVLDAAGNPVIDPSGSVRTIKVDTSTLLGSEPLARNSSTVSDTTSVNNRWKLKGAYFTFRVGPTVLVPITEHLNITLSAGAVLVFAGSTYTVTQDFKPTSSDDIVNTVSDGVSEFMPGYYVDANVNYTFTDSAGLYLGIFHQGSGSYVQTITSSPDNYTATAYAPSTTSTYTTRVDLSNLQGIRAGMTFKF